MLPPLLQQVTEAVHHTELTVAGIVSILASAVASVAGIAWKARGDQIASLVAQLKEREAALVKKDDIINEVRNAQLAELRANLQESNRNLNAATQAIVGSTGMLESRAELEDQILQLVRQNAADITKIQIALDRVERATESCRRGP